MTEQEQQIAIAEACGFHRKPKIGSVDGSCSEWIFQNYSQWGRFMLLVGGEPPDFLHDLNAMHEAENTLDGPQLALMESTLQDTMRGVGRSPWTAFHATASQRAKAFLLTVNKWKE